MIYSDKKAAALLIAAAMTAVVAGGWSTIAAARKADATAEPRLQLNKKFRAAMATAQAALARNDLVALKAALAAAKPLVATADEQFVVDQYELNLAQMTGDRAGTTAALDRLIASGTAAGQLSQNDKARYYAGQGELAFQAGNYVKAEQSFAAALAAGNRDPQMAIFLAESQLRGGRPADAVRHIRFAIDTSNAAGRKAPSEWYARGAEIASRTKLAMEFVDITSAWVAAYPDRDSWYVSLTGYRQMSALPADADRDLLRLARVAASPHMFTLKDYLDHTQLISPLSLNEAVTLLREGIAAGKISESENPTISRLLTKVDPRIAAERKKLGGKLASVTGYAAVTAQADALYGIREFARAADLYELALAQPGADVGQGNVRLAAALAQAGDKPGALAALDKVTAGSYAPLAAYWRAWIGAGSQIAGGGLEAPVTG